MTKLKNRLIKKLLLVGAIVIGGLFLLRFTSSPPANLGHIDGKLADCPASPNCVATQTDQADKQMKPISFAGSPGEAVAKLKAIIAENFPRARLVSAQEDYLHYEFVSLVFRYVDDVEFVVDQRRQKIDFRSASRTGYSDLGVNRKRMQQIIELMQRSPSSEL